MSNSRKCTAIKSDGQPCKGWAVHGSDLALCSVHTRLASKPAGSRSIADQELIRHGTLVEKPACRYTLEQIAGLLRENADGSLDDELVIARLAVRRLMQQLEDQLTPHEFAHLAGVIFTGTNSIVRLLKSQQDLEDHSAEDMARAMHQALDETSEEMGISL